MNEYVKDDGTYVREHYRGLPSNSENYIAENTDEAVKTLYGGISEDIPFEKQAAPEQLIPAAGRQIGEIMARTLFAAADVLDSSGQVQEQNFTNGIITGFEPPVNDTLLRLLEAQEEADKQEAETLKKLVTTKDKTEYKNLYRTYQQQKAQNKETKTAIAKIQHVVENNYTINKNQQQYQTPKDRLLLDLNSIQAFINPNFNNNFKPENLSNSILKNINKISNFTLFGIPDYTNNLYIKTHAISDAFKFANQENSIMQKAVTALRRGGLHDHPLVQKICITAVMQKYGNKNAYDANELWKATAYNFEQSKEYIAQNGYLIDSTSYLQLDLRNFVRNKLKEQIGKQEAKGILFRPDSNLSKEIASCQELRKFIIKHYNQLQSGQHITDSTYLGSTTNLALSLGHVDIYNAHIDSKGNFKALIIDTYDFNKDDKDYRVEIAYNVQRHGLITNFYTINIIYIPQMELNKLCY